VAKTVVTAGIYSKVSAMPVSVAHHLSELDNLLAELSNARYSEKQVSKENLLLTTSSISTSYRYKDSQTDRPQLATQRPARFADAFTQPIQPSLTTRSGSSTLSSRKQGKLDDIKTGFKEPNSDPLEAKDDYTDYDYSSKWDYLGKGIWENQDYGTLSNYSTLHTSHDEYDYSTLERDYVTLSEEELEKETGAGPRGDRSKVIETDHGEVQSKYRYMGFGLWENTDPTAPKKRKKLRPPPPPPKAQPIMYVCTVSVAESASTKELDDLLMRDCGGNLKSRNVEVSPGTSGSGAGDPFDMFEKEDMSDMFKRAMLEKMNLVDDPPIKYKCFVCSNMIQGRIITAMGNKFHPQCFTCTYCSKEFKSRKYKTDPRDCKPYCYDCFEKLLGHYGNAHHG